MNCIGNRAPDVQRCQTSSKVALENMFCLTQRQSPRQESSWICGSANVFGNLSPSASEVQLRFSRKMSPLCIFIYLSFKGFCSYQKKGGRGGYFSGATLMRPSPRFHGDNHKTVKFPVFQTKKTLSGGGGGGGCSSTVRGSFSKSVSFLLEGETFLLFFP